MHITGVIQPPLSQTITSWLKAECVGDLYYRTAFTSGLQALSSLNFVLAYCLQPFCDMIGYIRQAGLGCAPRMRCDEMVMMNRMTLLGHPSIHPPISNHKKTVCTQKIVLTKISPVLHNHQIS